MIAEWLMRVISNIVISHVLSLMLLVGLNYYILLRARKTPLMMSYLFLSLAPFLWILGKLLKNVAPTIGLRWMFIMVQYFGMSMAGPAFIIFCLTYRMKRLPSLPVLAICFLPALFLYGLVLTNPLHHLFYPVFTFYRDSFGPVFQILKYEIYVCTGLSYILLLTTVVRYRKKQAVQSVLFILAAVGPLVGSLYYPNLGERFSGLRFDIVPLCFNITFLFFGVAVFKYDFLDIPPMARRQILDALTEGVCIRDSEGRILYENQAASVSRTAETGKMYKRAEYSMPGKHHGPVLRLESVIDVTGELARKTAIHRRTGILKRLAGRVEEYTRREREVLYMQQRNKAARELHDVMGHSLTLFIARLESLRLLDDENERRKRFDEACAQFYRWRDDLTVSLASGTTVEEQEEVFLSRWISPLIRSCGDDTVSVELVVRGSEPPLKIDIVRDVFAVVRESLTNSLRHGRADQVLLSLSFDDECRILIMDNGAGCDEVREGNGLEGIRRRMESLGGSVSFTSSRGEGFISRFSLPV